MFEEIFVSDIVDRNHEMLEWCKGLIWVLYPQHRDDMCDIGSTQCSFVPE